MNKASRAYQKIRKIWAILCLAIEKFFEVDGVQWAGAFAFNAFFSLFPLMILLVTIASFFIDQGRAGQEVIAYMEGYVPINAEMRDLIFGTIGGVIKARGQAGAFAFLILIWVVLQGFITLMYATNRAWGAPAYRWWMLPLKSLMLLGVTATAVLLGMAAPELMRVAAGWVFSVNDLRSWVYALGSFAIPLLVVFISLSLFYKLAPHRPTRFAQVWLAALCATTLLQTAESLFVIYLKNFATFNAVYGAFGGIMALLLWIYVSGCIFIFGACLCGAQAEGSSTSVKAMIAS